MGNQLLLGTESGLILMNKSRNGWTIDDKTLEGKWVQKLEIDSTGRIFAGVTGDGVYKSDSFSSTWKRTLEGDIRGLAISPHDQSILFAGTEPAAIFRSQNGGSTWVELNSIKKLPTYGSWWFPAPPNISHVRTFDFVPGEPHTVFAGVEVGGLIRSNDDGDTWEEFGEGIYEDIHYILAHPSDANVMYSTTGKGFYKSSDGARTWEFSPSGMDNFYAHPIVLQSINPEVLFVGAAKDTPSTFGGPNGAAARIYRSRNAGVRWEPLGNGLPDRLHGMVRGLATDPADHRVVFAGTTDGHLYLSEDEGDNWALLTKDLPPVWVIRVQ